MPQVSAQSLAALDQHYNATKQTLDRMLSGLLSQIESEHDEAAGWLGTVQVSLAHAKQDPEYLESVVQLAVAAFIRLAKNG